MIQAPLRLWGGHLVYAGRFIQRFSAKNPRHGLPFSRAKSGRVTSSESERTP